eukprot:TRINITY_DN5949_c0_g1_i1.p1 TRINITY_DN5949_c0_g1~~TRINITY_DN5949_c0_g1_i1.p1  ORF type:complete len:245 (-),score=73.31 TRINITY_DN5949_c0_g1_i1:165-851(-)
MSLDPSIFGAPAADQLQAESLPIQTHDDMMFAAPVVGIQTPGNEFMSPLTTVQTGSLPSSAVNTNPTPGSNQGSIPSSPFATNDTSKASAINPWGFPKKDDYEAPTFLQWKEDHEKELKEKASKSEERQARVRDAAKEELKKINEEREKHIKANKAKNKEHEATLQASHKADSDETAADWSRVLVIVEHNAKLTAQKNNNPTASNERPVAKRDTSRMREVLQKLSKAH